MVFSKKHMNRLRTCRWQFVQADELSRKFYIDTEWKLDTSLLCEVLALLNIEPTIDLFVLRISHQFPRYASFNLIQTHELLTPLP